MQSPARKPKASDAAREKAPGRNSGATLSRRELLKSVGVCIALPGAVLIPSQMTAAPTTVSEELESFTSSEAATVRAFVERLIPPDENGPGAIEAGVPRYIDRLLRGPMNTYRGPNNPDRNLTDCYTAGLKAMDSFVRATYGTAFSALDAERQDAVLTAMQANQAPGFTPNSRTFFNLVRQHAMEGMFGDPYYGGNVHFVGWDLIGYPGIKLAFTENEQKLDVVVKSSRKGTTDYALFGKNRRGM